MLWDSEYTVDELHVDGKNVFSMLFLQNIIEFYSFLFEMMRVLITNNWDFLGNSKQVIFEICILGIALLFVCFLSSVFAIFWNTLQTNALYIIHKSKYHLAMTFQLPKQNSIFYMPYIFPWMNKTRADVMNEYLFFLFRLFTNCVLFSFTKYYKNTHKNTTEK